MSTNSATAVKKSVCKRFLCMILAFAMTMSTLYTGELTVKAQEEMQGDSLGRTVTAASPSDSASKSVAELSSVTDSRAKKLSGMVKVNNRYRFYVDGKPVMKKGWRKTAGKDIYIDAKGYVEKVYNVKSGKLVLYKGTTAKAAAYKECVLSNGYNYLFNAAGVRVASAGWKTVKNVKYYAVNGGILTVKYVKTGDIIRLYGDTKGKGNWKQYRNTWKTLQGVSYYFASNGVCTKFYDTRYSRAKILSGKKMVLARNRVTTLNNGKEYYFGASGVLVRRTGWYTLKRDLNIYVNASGRVIGKICKQGGIYRFYMIDTTGKKWVLQKNRWVSDNSMLYGISRKGNATVVYVNSAKRLYEYSGKAGKYVPVKNRLSRLNGKAYYLYNANGVRVTSEGWKKVSDTTYYYICSKGYMKARYMVSGSRKKLYNYDYQADRWSQVKASWGQVGGSKYYFDSKGLAKIAYDTESQRGYVLTDDKWVLIKNSIQKVGNANYFFDGKGVRVKKAGVYKTSNGYLAYVNKKGVVYKREYNLEIKRYYKIDLGKGKSTTVYGYYDLGAAKKLMNSVNEHRKANGLTALDISSSMTETATTRAKEISNTYSHYRPNKTLCINSMYELFGENLACGFSDESLVLRAWMKSSSHDRNMLDTSYKTMGAAVFIALDKDKEGFKRYYVLTFGK